MVSIAARMKELRRYFGKTQKEFAHIAGVSQGNISDMEKGKIKPSIDTVESVCRFFRISPDWLLLGIGNCPGTILEEDQPSEPCHDQGVQFQNRFNSLSAENKKFVISALEICEYKQKKFMETNQEPASSGDRR